MEQIERLMFISLEGELSLSAEADAAPPPASVIAAGDPFYRASSDDPDDFAYDEPPLGTVSSSGLVGHESMGSWTITFTFFDDGSTITAVGRLPIVKARPGAGVVAVVGGTGRFAGIRGQLDVRVRNPHRWTVS